MNHSGLFRPLKITRNEWCSFCINFNKRLFKHLVRKLSTEKLPTIGSKVSRFEKTKGLLRNVNKNKVILDLNVPVSERVPVPLLEVVPRTSLPY